MKHQVEQLRYQYQTSSSEIESLKLKVQIQEQTSREWEKKASLLATYPELVGHGVPVLEVEDSVEGQLKSQIEANRIRIDLLTTETHKLQSALGEFKITCFSTCVCIQVGKKHRITRWKTYFLNVMK